VRLGGLRFHDRLFIGGIGGLVIALCCGYLKLTNRFAEAFGQIRQFLPAKKEQRDTKNDKEFGSA
jgi:hypothetical protein